MGLRRYLCEKDLVFLRLFINLLKHGPPHPIVPGDGTNILVFMGACNEREARTWTNGIGGVLVGSTLARRRFFSLELDDAHISKLGERSKKQIIFEAETLPAAPAILLWKNYLTNRCCIVFCG